MATVDFFYDIGSPFSYLASTQIEAIASDCRAQLNWRPFLLGGVFKATENAPPAFNMTKARYLARDLERWATYYGVPLHTVVPPMNTLTAMRVLTSLPAEQVPSASHRLFRAYWVDGRDATDPTVIADLLGPDAVRRASEDSVKHQLRATTEEAVRRGAFGAPTFFVGDEMFFGNDRLPFVEQLLRRAHAPA